MNNETETTADFVTIRKEKIKQIREKGINPYPARFERSSFSSDIIKDHTGAGDPPGRTYTIAGRIMTLRIMGKSLFFNLKDVRGTVQVYVKKDIIGDDEYLFIKKLVDVGDIVGVTGGAFKTKTGEITLKAQAFTLLSKSMRSLPEKWHGLKDVETRYRNRSVDLIVNDPVKEVFLKRSRIISCIRSYLSSHGYQEVETPILQPIPGGATARPFKTFHNTLELELYLRIAPELYLKKLIVGGLDQIFEIGRCFRNEGIDARHNPEFTICEIYRAFSDYTAMMDLSEELIKTVLQQVNGSPLISYRGLSIDCSKPFKRVELNELISTVTGYTLREIFSENRLKKAALALHIQTDSQTPEHKIFDRIFDEKILPGLAEPTFVTGYPKETTPLAKARYDTPEIVERFELFIAHEEIANAYSELNDPEEQKRRFLDQKNKHDSGDVEASVPDMDFVEALEQAMPPTGGLGIGIDRLTMLVTGSPTIRDVLLFPLLKPQKKSNLDDAAFA